MHPNGDMLRLARQLRGFQQSEAAKRLGVEQPTLSRIENGMVEFREEILLRAMSVYDLPRSFFCQTDPIYGAPVSVHPMWRKKADVSAREMDRVVAELNVRTMHLRRMLEGADVSHSNDLPKLDIDEYGSAEKIAGVLRAHWRLPRGPVRDLTLHAEKAGVVVAHSTLNGSSISGVTFASPGLPPLIVLNSDQPADRMRFTLAHELGHLVMHRFPNPNMEEEAHEFASALLLPNSDIRPYFVGRKIDLTLLAALKPEWKVSMAALLMAASKLGFLTENQGHYLWKQMSAKGYRLREPPETEFAQEQPTVIKSLIDVHQRGLGYSLDELASMLHTTISGMRDLYAVNDNSNGQSRPKLTILK